MDDLLKAESHVGQWKQWESVEELKVGLVTSTRCRRLNPVVGGTNNIGVNQILGSVVASVKWVVKQKMCPNEFVVKCRVPVGSAPTGNRNGPPVAAALAM